MKTKQIVLNSGLPLLPVQEQLIRSSAYLSVILGGWGSGKSHGAVLAFLIACIEEPGTEARYGNDRPLSMVVSPTFRVLRDSAYRIFKQVCPPELIKREWNSPNFEILLTNNHMIAFRTQQSTIEGASLVNILVDEIHLLRSEKVWLNLQSRARDPRARRRRVIASGLPEYGWLRECFGDDVASPNRLVLFCSSYDNTYLPAEVLEELRRSAPADAAAKYIEGKWQPKEGLVYYAYDPAIHRVRLAPDPARPVHVGLDVGDKSAVVIGQIYPCTLRDSTGKPYKSTRLHVIDEIAPRNKSTEEIARLIKARGHRLDPAVSSLATDPTIRADEIASLRRVLGPELPIIRRSRKNREASVEAGHLAVNVALKDANSSVRLTFSDHLPTDSHSLHYALLGFSRKSGKIRRDDHVDHMADANRYLVQANLAAPIEGYGESRRRR